MAQASSSFRARSCTPRSDTKVLLGQLNALVVRDLPQLLRVESVSGRCTNEIRNKRVPGKGTYTANFEVRHLVELKGAFEGGLDLGTDFVLRLPDLLLLLLVAIKTRGASVLDHQSGVLPRSVVVFFVGV